MVELPTSNGTVQRIFLRRGIGCSSQERHGVTHEAEIQLDEINRLLKLYEKEQSVETADQVISAYKKQIGLLGKIIESLTGSDVIH